MDIVARLDRSRYKPHLIVPEPGPLVDWMTAHGVPHNIVPGMDYTGWASTLRRAAKMLPVFMRNHVRIVHAMAETCYRAAAIAGTVMGAARIVHFGYPPDLPKLQDSLPVGPDALVGCYNGQARELGQLVGRFRPTCRVVGIPNGIDVDHFTVGPTVSSPLRARAGDASHVVLAVGHLSEVKGHSTFLRAAALVAASHHRCRFWLLGDETTDKGARSRFEALVEEIGICDRVEFLGWRSDTLDVLQAADVVALPSLNEGLPLAVLEAMACGRPVVATPVGGVMEAVEDGHTGFLIPPNEPQALAKAICDLLDNEALRCKLGQQARVVVEKHFSLPRVLEQVEHLYQELLGELP
ncbi:MAG: glycosyltransferase family 4 protein [Candidatus Competibacter denitrificans]|jgi:glycosyltransferase involved in cell wall biosynthesis